MVVVFAIVLPVLLGCVGVAVDYATWLVRKQQLQAIADATALSVVADMQVGAYDRRRIQAVAESQVKSLAGERLGRDPITVKAEPVYRRPGATGGGFTEEPSDERDRAPSGVRVSLSQRKRAIMTTLVKPQLTDITVQATAEMVGISKVCVIALDGHATGGIDLRDRARVSATGCSVYALSASAAAIDARDTSELNALKSCSVGGYAGPSQRYQPVPITGCPAIKDPLAGRVAPAVGPCKFQQALVIGNESRTLDPGTYCGGLILTAGAQVKLNPGIYVIKDGPLVIGSDMVTVQGHHVPAPCLCYHKDTPRLMRTMMGCAGPSSLPAASLSGDEVGFYFTGTVAPEQDNVARPLQMLPRSGVSLSAPTGGAMAGLLFFEDRNAAANRSFEVLSDNARRLVGTIYMPRGTFLVAADQVVADRSEYTAIIAQKLVLSQAPRLVVNANYSATAVPVPQGVGPTSARPALTN
ncbi:TadE/TadG family type IV pilus assembly protein [Methylobacterium sp. ap11]|uniref:TadE/TadG family type IV pilus assembly protein n=1 Tax=Methylobacterium sp. ap11 TaxID=1761799 RepID=UPI001FCDD54C|nr:TadE/TadG family type IV pilus assembly protein [Methylobacterium sp. ap11]